MTPLRTTLAMLLLAALLLAAGCVSQQQTPAAPARNELTPVSTPSATLTVSPAATMKEKTVPVPEKTETTPPPESKNPDYIIMDAESYTAGEDVEFYLVNKGSDTIQCGTTDPGYAVSLVFQDGTSKIVARSGVSHQVISVLPPGSKTRTYTLNTLNWMPGRYLVQVYCGKGISREFTLQENHK